MVRIFNFVKKYLFHLTIILSNILLLKKFLTATFNKTNIFLVGNRAIGHYPANMFFAKQIYGANTIFVHKSGVNFANKYLQFKIYNSFLCFNFAISFYFACLFIR